MSLTVLALFLVVGVSLPEPSFGLDNGLARTPAMGYNSWYDVGCSGDMNEDIIKATADAIVEKGLDKLGYIYVNLDDCWAKGRDSQGAVFPDPNTFKSGMKPLADYIHSKGLKFGVYSDRGTNTCAGRPGALNHEEIDAKTYAGWGVDYLKEDSCHADGSHASGYEEYGRMRDALNATGRPIYFSLCGWNAWYAPVGYSIADNYSSLNDESRRPSVRDNGRVFTLDPTLLSASIANSWRIGPDDTNWHGVLSNIEINANLAHYAGPGGWNDPCLLLGNTSKNQPRLTDVQQRTQFNMWAIMASPLLISSNIRNISAYGLATYSNAEVIAVNQDPLGKQGIRLSGDSLVGESVVEKYLPPMLRHKMKKAHMSQPMAAGTNVWGRELHDGSWAFVFLNTGTADTDITCDVNCFKPTGFDTSTNLTVRDLWMHEVTGHTTGATYTAAKVPANGGSTMLKMTLMF